MTGAIYSDFTQFGSLRAEATENPNVAVEEVAAQFESLFLQQMLKTMRDATVKSDLMNSDSTDTYQSMADQQLALQLSEQGGIGLARMMVEQMQTKGMVSAGRSEESSLGLSTGGAAAAMRLDAAKPYYEGGEG
ncbi:mannosyl-glycoprotein endo-beta-N-acetylglucosamidase [Candidatus Paraluminiphilus aquimaris]|uniref:Mannosyl-glycoprotein endo-beta-N-acetylglucosamidase n=1 Tax=Candidatus Paraluminiphilus aquimaris TaxID=2518994 RepID=A0ABY6Q5I1_9GAMM|nr:rod-binding protein [Candidatus Paraluminiphilus aquimaris]UZP73790.1 mannosyl-glycoprotein endo-beta-N-acetylglucosamidase [Candidatus Paraluminiphilus aquimaris]